MIETSPRTLTITTSSERQPWHVEWHDVLSSTMDRARELARAGLTTDHVVVADYQSSGRGTHGRTWIAPPGTCLMFSIVLRPRIAIPELAHLPRRIAQSVCDELNLRYGTRVVVDPPNDLMIDGDKLAGVLCQSHLRGRSIEWVICGIGLNTNLFSAELNVPGSTSLALATGQRYHHELLLEQLLTALDRHRDL